ncbi:MAG: hypothetical protein N3B21_00745 [Clostridia bacterium]|nr:hypothetical protein [Clostridia bacterium]
MINRHELGKKQCLYAIEHGEFSDDVIKSKDKVVVIMTQDWCPQWQNMQSWVYGLDIADDIDVYELIYNKVDYRDDFMKLKESKWRNDQIPYLRYYRDGKLFKETNYVSAEKFKELVQK